MTLSLENKKEGRGDARGLLFRIRFRFCCLREVGDYYLVGAPETPIWCKPAGSLLPHPHGMTGAGAASGGLAACDLGLCVDAGSEKLAHREDFPEVGPHHADALSAV